MQYIITEKCNGIGIGKMIIQTEYWIHKFGNRFTISVTKVEIRTSLEASKAVDVG